MKKLLLGLGSIAAIAAPVATVVACGSDDTTGATVTVDKDKLTATIDLGSVKLTKATATAALKSLVDKVDNPSPAVPQSFQVTFKSKLASKDTTVQIDVPATAAWTTTEATTVFNKLQTDLDGTNKADGWVDCLDN